MRAVTLLLLLFITGHCVRMSEAVEPSADQIRLEVKHIELRGSNLTIEDLKPFAGNVVPATNTWWLNDSFKAGFPTNKNVTIEGLFQPSKVRVISEEQIKNMLHGWENRDGVDVMALPRVMISGRRVSEIGMRFDLAKGLCRFQGDGEDGKMRLEDRATGAGVMPSLRVRPQVQADGKTIRVDWVADIVKIVDFESYPVFVGKLTPLDAPVPEYRVRQLTGSQQLKEGEALMIGCGVFESISKGGIGESDKTWKSLSVLLLTLNFMKDGASDSVSGK